MNNTHGVYYQCIREPKGWKGILYVTKIVSDADHPRCRNGTIHTTPPSRLTDEKTASLEAVTLSDCKHQGRPGLEMNVVWIVAQGVDALGAALNPSLTVEILYKSLPFAVGGILLMTPFVVSYINPCNISHDREMIIGSHVIAGGVHGILCLGSFPVVTKDYMRLLGFEVGESIRPNTRSTPDNMVKLKQLLDDLGAERLA
jgi:hypothetical protein